MNKKQRWLAYAIVCFLLVWGWDIVDKLKFKGKVAWNDIFSPFHVTQLIYILLTLLATRWVFKKYYAPKKFGLLLVFLPLLVAGFIVFRYLLEQVMLPGLFGISNYPLRVNIGFYALDNLYYGVVYITLGILIFMLYYQLLSQKKEAALKQERTDAELAFLRSQVSPHFLFNSLNNIYALSCHQPDKAPDAILRLSDLTRYMLYEKQETVPVEKEWQYIGSLVELQKLRYEKPLQLQISCQGDLQQTIAPYLLIPFVENAFKHGIMDNPEKPLNIQLVIDGAGLRFRVENYIGFQQKDKDGGIGLDNTRRRLNLLYPKRHNLEITQKDNWFMVELKLQYK
jgi:two-component system LytT family sensor kinase